MKFRQADDDMPGGRGREVEAYLTSVVNITGCSPGLFVKDSFQRKVIKNCWIIANGLDPNNAIHTSQVCCSRCQ